MTPESLKVTGGIWGYRPCDCATVANAVHRALHNMTLDALDGTALWRFTVDKHKPVEWRDGEDTQPSAYYWTVIGIVEGTLHHGGTLPMKVIRQCLTWLKAIARDKAWLDTWHSPKLIRRSVAAYITLFTGLLEAAKPRKVEVNGKLVTRRITDVTGWCDWPMVEKLNRAQKGFGPLGRLPNGNWRLLIGGDRELYTAFTKTMRGIKRVEQKLLMDCAVARGMDE